MPHFTPEMAVDALIRAIGEKNWRYFCLTEEPEAQIAFLRYHGISSSHIERHFIFWQMAADEERAIIAA